MVATQLALTCACTFVFAFATATATAAAVKVPCLSDKFEWAATTLRVDGLSERDASGIDSPTPVFTWVWKVVLASTRMPSENAPRGTMLPLPTADSVTVDVSLVPFEDDVALPQIQQPLLWTAPAMAVEVNGAAATKLQYDGPQLPSATRVYWQVCSKTTNETHCDSASFVTGLLSSESWGNAKWIGGRQLRSPTLKIPAGTTSMVVSVTGLGFYELLVNGEKVGDAVLDPGFSTNYTERILYATYDISNQTLHKGVSEVSG